MDHQPTIAPRRPVGPGPKRLPAKLTNRPAAAVIDRPRLFERLDAARNASLTWLQGPVGAGKTLLVSSYLQHHGLPALWYRVDAGDADPSTILAYLAQAGDALAGATIGLPTLTPEYVGDLAGFARRYFRQLFEALPAGTVLVFDGFEAAPGDALAGLLRLAAAELPTDQRLLVSSRDALPDDTVHLQSGGMAAVIDWEALQLTVDEAAALAESGGALPVETVRRLHARAGGWAAGFVVMLMHLRRTGRLVDDDDGMRAQHLFPHYLRELFDSVGAPVQSLLMATALLPEFTIAQAESLVPSSDAEAVLQRLARRHYFIEECHGLPAAYRYHTLFREFLVRQGVERLGAPERQALQQRAAALLEADGEDEAALRILLEAQAWPPAARLAHRMAPRLLEQGRQVTLRDLLAALPAGSGGPIGPWLDYWHGLAWIHDDAPRARRRLESAYSGLEAAADRAGTLLACATILETYLAEWSDMHGADRWGDTLYRLLPDLDAVGSPEVAVRVLSRTSVLLFRGPRHADLIEAAGQRAELLLARVSHPRLRLALANFLGLWHYLRGTWEAGRHLIADVDAAPHADALPIQLVIWHTLKARLHLWSGDIDAAHAAADAAERLASEHQIGGLLALTASASVFAAVNTDDSARARDGLRRMRTGLQPSRRLDQAAIDFHQGVVALAEGGAARAVFELRAAVDEVVACGADQLAAPYRVELALALAETGEFAAAASELQQVVDFATASRQALLEHGALLVSAWLAQRSGFGIAALHLLRAALPLGREHGYRVIFPWVPQAMLQSLGVLALRHGIEPAYVRELIRARRVPPPAGDADAWPWLVRVSVLGPFELLLEDRPLPAAGKTPRKPLELLKLLAVSTVPGSAGLALGSVLQSLWPDLDGDAAQNALNVTLYRLRRMLGDAETVQLRDGHLRLDPQRVWSDTGAFERVAEQLMAGSGLVLDERLLDLYRGELLPDVDAPWAEAPRQRLRQHFRKATGALSDRLESAGRLAAALALQQRALDVDPLSEEMHRRHIRCLAACGRGADALEAYRHCRHLLSEAFGRAPSAATEQLRASLEQHP